MRSFMKITYLVVLFVCLDATLTQADNSIGAVKKLNGAATVVREKTEYKLNIGAPVFIKDVLKTGNTGSLGITFKDNTMISIGPNTVYTIDEYVYQPDDQKFAFVSKVSKGTLHFISGNLIKLAPNAVKVKTPEATIGLRGTRLLVKVD